MRGLIVVLVTLVVTLASAHAWAGKYVPPPIAGHVTDKAGKLSAGEIEALDQKLADYRRCSSAHIAVFLPASLEGNSVEDVAYIAFNTWHIGEAKKDNGVLLVLAPNERKIRIETGKGTGGDLTDVESSHILRDVVGPNMKADRFFAAADQATTQIGKALAPNCPIADVDASAAANPAPYVPYAPPPPPPPDPHTGARVLMAFAIGLFGLLGAIGLRWHKTSPFVGALVGFLNYKFMADVATQHDKSVNMNQVLNVFIVSVVISIPVLLAIWARRIWGKGNASYESSSASSWTASSSTSDSSSSTSSSYSGGSDYSSSSSSSSSDYSGGGGSSGGGGASDSY